MSESVKYISAKEFRDLGYLQEANRLFFHPLGLALEVTTDPGVDERSFITGVWDCRDDPEGIYFVLDSEEFAETFAAKAAAVRLEWAQRRRPRVEALRFMVQPSANHFDEIGSDIMQMFGDALGIEMSKVIPVKATSQSWQTAMRGIFDKVCQMFADEPYNPQVVSPEEVHTMDLVLGLEALTGARTRIEALNMLVDSRRAYKEERDTLAAYLVSISEGDWEPGTDARDVALQALKDIGWIDERTNNDPAVQDV